MQRNEPEILVVGYNACDLTVSLPGAPPVDGKLEVDHMRLGGGGPGATAAVALARLGAQVRLATPLADDPAGGLQRTELKAAGVDVSACPAAQGAATPLAAILVDPRDGSRSILWSRGELPALAVPEDPEALLGTADLLYVDGHEPAAAAACALVARRRRLPVVMDAGTFRAGSRDLAAACTDVVSSTVFAPALAGSDDPAVALRTLRALGPERVAMTFGADGVLALDGDGFFAVPAFAVEAVDTTGAGDVFHAGYAYALVTGRGFADALRYGAATAAIKCRSWGGRGGLPTAAAVEELLATGPVRAPGGPLAGIPLRRRES
ncbi:MAG: hypothetical protein GY838_06470 [bacterium]|nr:hypothetical protein [bacterium]